MNAALAGLKVEEEEEKDFFAATGGATSGTSFGASSTDVILAFPEIRFDVLSAVRSDSSIYPSQMLGSLHRPAR